MNRKGFLILEMVLILAFASFAGYVVHDILTQPAPVECADNVGR
jgi:hypothetical protein